VYKVLVLGALISLQTLQNALNLLGYPAVTLFIMIESSGIPFPGETMLLLASFYAGTTGQLSIVGVLIACAIGAIVGDNLGYLAGRYGGRPFALRFGKYFFLKEKHLIAAEAFFVRHGDKTVFFGRFIAVLRAWAAFLAGVNRMRWPKFLLYNAAGGIAWTTIMGLFAYFAGKIIGNNFTVIERIGRGLGFFGLAVVVGPVLIWVIVKYVRKRRQERATAAEAAAAAAEVPASAPAETAAVAAPAAAEGAAHPLAEAEAEAEEPASTHR
jgi:membrane protein DedA with SNARE-associated domain